MLKFENKIKLKRFQANERSESTRKSNLVIYMYTGKIKFNVKQYMHYYFTFLPVYRSLLFSLKIIPTS